MPKDETIDFESNCELLLSTGREKIKIVFQNKKIIIFKVVNLDVKMEGPPFKLCSPVFLLEGDHVMVISGFDKKVRAYQTSERFIENFKIEIKSMHDDEDILVGAPVFNCKGSLISIFIAEYGFVSTANFLKLGLYLTFINFYNPH